MKLKKKLKKINKPLLITYLITTIVFMIGLVLLSINLYSFSGIETLIKSLILAFFALMVIFYILYGFVWLFTEKKLKLIIFTIFIILFSLIIYGGNYYLNKTYGIIDNINKETITYTTDLIILKDHEFNNNEDSLLGMIDNEDDIAGHVLAKELIKNEKIKSEIIYYGNYHDMIEDLYNEKIDGLFIANNYDAFLKDEELYNDISTKTKVYKSLSKKIQKQNTQNTTNLSTKPFTVLLMGIDSTKNGLNKNDSFNGDSIILITFNPKTLTSTFLSIPRDTYVPITCNKNRENKINSSAYSGSQCMINTITNFTGIEIDYYFKMNFTGLVDLIDALGGVTVDVPYSFCEQDSQRRFGEHTIYVKKGVQKLNGEKALALSRNRHGWPSCSKEWNLGNRNDFVRGQNQQLVVQGILNEMKTVRNVNSLLNILNVVSKNMDTNMSTNQILSFYDIAKQILANSIKGNDNVLKIDKLYLQTKTLTINKVGAAEIYQDKSLAAIVNAMKTNLGIVEPVQIKTFEFDANNAYEQVDIGKGLYDGFDKYSTVPSFIGGHKDVVLNWGRINGITINIKEVSLEDKESGIVMSQSVPATTLISNTLKSIEITVQN